ncbi:MAG TPA: hypothetical protein VN132_07125, partial [Bdellovibrio sp.]|nr:hypothetical protein [Bdellovibrio sp.]
MKMLITLFLLVFSFNVSQAYSPTAYEPEICLMMASSTGKKNPYFKTTASINVVTAKSLEPFYLKLVNEYLLEQQFITAPATLQEIQYLFKHGEQQWNDLYVKIRVSRVTGAAHIEVLSYPGDNAVGTVFDLDGNVIAHDGDDNYIYISSNGKDISCLWK